MRIRISLVLLVLLLLVAPGCFGESEDDVARRLDEKSARDVLEEASEDEYTPPEDGRLTRDQIEMYLHVREREQEIARTAKEKVEEGAQKLKEGEKSFSGLMEGLKSLRSVADFATAEVRAAQELGYNTAEYEWVKSKVLEAAGSVVTDRISSSSKAMLDRRAEELRRKMDETENDTERNTYERLLEVYEKNASSDPGAPEEDVAYNRERLSEYENALETIGFELSRWELREGQAAERIEQFDRKMKQLNGEAEE